jgi:hypothetical protein
MSVKRELGVGGGNYLAIACDHGPAAGWTAFYMHVNNDNPGTDDGKGTKSWAFPSGIATGVRVLAGQLVAWRGDSGDAESTGAHLHFELRKGSGWGGIVYNAYPSLGAAMRLAAPRPSGPHPDGTLMSTPAGNLFVVEGLLKRPVSRGIAAANGLSDPVPAGAREVARYGTLGPLPLRDGSLVRDPGGAVWRVLGSSRFAVTPAAGQRVTPVVATDVSGLSIIDPPLSLLTSGVLVRAAGLVYVVGTDGLVRPVSSSVMASWGWTAADVVDLPLEVPLPEVGTPLGLRDGTLVQLPGVKVGVVSGGVLRRIWDTRELRAYGYAGRRRLVVPADVVAGLPVDELAAGLGRSRLSRQHPAA